jgi:hypothetical protein
VKEEGEDYGLRLKGQRWVSRPATPARGQGGPALVGPAGHPPTGECRLWWPAGPQKGYSPATAAQSVPPLQLPQVQPPQFKAAVLGGGGWHSLFSLHALHLQLCTQDTALMPSRPCTEESAAHPAPNAVHLGPLQHPSSHDNMLWLLGTYLCNIMSSHGKPTSRPATWHVNCNSGPTSLKGASVASVTGHACSQRSKSFAE